MIGVLLAAVLAFLGLAAPAQASELISIATPSRNVDTARAVFNGPPPKELRANVLLPDGYTPTRRWPLLVLLHGIGDTYETWARPDRGDIVATAKGLPAIVVMPEGGRGFYTNWFNGGKRGDPGWERFYLDELIPTIEARFPILPGRPNHAIAGLSMGGFGASYLGSQRPDYFGAVAAFSGFVQHQRAEVAAGLRTLGGAEYEDIFGPMRGQYATGHNPTRIVANLRRSRLFVAAGDGIAEPGVSSEPAAVAAGGAVEAGLRQQNEEFTAAARAAEIDLTYRPQTGVHDWPYWRRHLRQAIEWGLFRPVVEDPVGWTYSTTATTGRMWGLAYAFTAPPETTVTFTREGGQVRGELAPGGAGATVRVQDVVTGCGFVATVPFDRALPAHVCGRIALQVSPRRLLAGRRTTLRVRAIEVADDGTRSALEGARVAFGRRSARTGENGRAALRVRARWPAGLRRVRVSHTGLPPARVRVRVAAARR